MIFLVLKSRGFKCFKINMTHKLDNSLQM
jgi:acetolactate synthase regulatory subunit